jgi:DNA-binding SARP family transcriptional activator
MDMVWIADINAVQIAVLGHFRLWHSGRVIELPSGATRLAALLAVVRHPMARPRIAALLWPGSPPAAARTDLRSAVHQLRRGCSRVLRADGEALFLGTDTRVDLYEAESLGNSLSAGAWLGDAQHALGLLCDDVLADWTDDWLSDVQTQHRLSRSFALERLSEALSRDGRHGAAVDAALLSVEADPLRESAWLALVRAHASEGNFGQALLEADRFVELVMRDLGVCVRAQFLQEVAALVEVRQLR